MVEILYYRTSEVYHLQVTLQNQYRITAVTVRMIDRGNGETLWEQALTAEEIASGRFVRNDYNLYDEAYVQSHLELLREGYAPDPVLEVAYTVRTDGGGEETFTRQAEPVDELWVSARYDLKDPEEDFLHYFLEETTYPDSFVVRIESTPYGGLTMYYGEGVALQPGDVSVAIFMDGQLLSGEGSHMERIEIPRPDGTLYAYALVVPRPASLPTSGTVQVHITRRLLHFPDTTRTDLKIVEY